MKGQAITEYSNDKYRSAEFNYYNNQFTKTTTFNIIREYHKEKGLKESVRCMVAPGGIKRGDKQG